MKMRRCFTVQTPTIGRTLRSDALGKNLYVKQFSTQKLLHRKACSQRSFYTQNLFDTNAFLQNGFYTVTPLHTGEFTHKKHSHKHTFTQTCFYTEKSLHTKAFSQRSFYTEKFLNRAAFTHRGFYTQNPRHTDAYTHKSICTEATFTHSSFYTKKPFAHRNFTEQNLQRLYCENGFHSFSPKPIGLVVRGLRRWQLRGMLYKNQLFKLRISCTLLKAWLSPLLVACIGLICLFGLHRPKL